MFESKLYIYYIQKSTETKYYDYVGLLEFFEKYVNYYQLKSSLVN